MQLTSTANVKSLLGISVTTYDTLISSLIDGVSSYIETVTGRVYGQATYTEYFDAIGNQFTVKNRPIGTSPALTVSYNNGTQATPVWVALASDDFVIDYTTGIVTIAYGFSTMRLQSNIQNIKIVYQGGYASAPADLELLAKQLTAKTFEQRKANGKTRESLGGASIDWRNEMTEAQAEILDSYKTIVI